MGRTITSGLTFLESTKAAAGTRGETPHTHTHTPTLLRREEKKRREMRLGNYVCI